MLAPFVTATVDETVESQPGQRILWTATTVAASLLAAVAGRFALKRTWRLATSQDPPVNPADPDTDLRDALLFTAATGAAIGVARMGARRGAAEAWKSAMGEMPPQLRAS